MIAIGVGIVGFEISTMLKCMAIDGLGLCALPSMKRSPLLLTIPEKFTVEQQPMM